MGVIATGGDKLTDKKHFTAFGDMNHRGDLMAANMHSATIPAAALIQTDQERERVDPDQRGRNATRCIRRDGVLFYETRIYFS
jgi:hypothetical protein